MRRDRSGGYCLLHFRKTVKRAATPVLLALLAGALTVARADAPTFGLRLGLGDYDQKWNTNNNQGKYYCVPATYLNLTYFLYNKGMNQLSAWAPAPNDSNEIKHRVYTLGDEDHLETDPESGTDAEDAFFYMTDFIADRSGDVILLHFFYGPDFNWGLGTISNLHYANAIMAIGYGRYYRHDSPLGSYWYRDGGHYMAFAGYDKQSTPNKIFTRNPASDDDDLSRQSGFDTDVRNTSSISFTTWDGPRVHARYSFDTGIFGNRRFIIDKMHVILPAYGGWNDIPGGSNNRSAAASSSASGKGASSPASSSGGKSEPPVKVVIPWQFEGSEGPGEFSFVPRERLVDWVFDHGELAAYYVTHLGRIFRVDLLSGDQKLVHVLKGAKALMVGGSTADLYVLGDKTQGKHDQPWIAQVDRDTNKVNVRPLSVRGVRLEYDPISGGPAVLADSLDKMLTLDDELRSESSVALPAVQAGAGDVLFKIAGDGSVYTGRMGDGSVRVIRRATDPRTEETAIRFVRFPVRSGIRSLVPVDKNTLLVQDGNTLQTYTPFGEVKPSQFSGMAVNGEFKMARTHFAAQAGSMRGFAWRNIDPAELEDMAE